MITNLHLLVHNLVLPIILQPRVSFDLYPKICFHYLTCLNLSIELILLKFIVQIWNLASHFDCSIIQNFLPDSSHSITNLVLIWTPPLRFDFWGLLHCFVKPLFNFRLSAHFVALCFLRIPPSRPFLRLIDSDHPKNHYFLQ